MPKFELIDVDRLNAMRPGETIRCADGARVQCRRSSDAENCRCCLAVADGQRRLCAGLRCDGFSREDGLDVIFVLLPQNETEKEQP